MRLPIPFLQHCYRSSSGLFCVGIAVTMFVCCNSSPGTDPRFFNDNNPEGWPAAQLELTHNDVVVFTGGTNIADFRKEGYLETLLIAASPGRKLHFRNMAWEGDVVEEQYRETGFEGWESNLDSVNCSILFVQFGQMESLKGEDSLPKFINDYRSLLSNARKKDRRIVVISPIPFEIEAFALTGKRVENIPAARAPVDKYAMAIKKMTAEEGYVYVDLFRQLKAHELNERYTTDGIHLTARAQQLAASLIMKELSLPWVYKEQYEPLRKRIQDMNSLWFQYWRAGNGAFIYGAETVQPFSRDWKDRNRRILPEERRMLEPYIIKAEQLIEDERANLK
ncbi:MAG: hypothetical protein KF862_16880 [Chitinophagaceae bacterium]|nr:hypothetical protein [Chitinophagaceae bacterium]